MCNHEKIINFSHLFRRDRASRELVKATRYNRASSRMEHSGLREVPANFKPREAPDALFRSRRDLHVSKDIKSKGKDMRCNDIVRGGKGGREEEEGRRVHRSVEEDARCIAYTTSIFIHQARLRFLSGEDSAATAVFPGERQMYRRSLRSFFFFFVLGVSHLRFVIALASSRNEENAFTRDRVHSSLCFASLSVLRSVNDSSVLRDKTRWNQLMTVCVGVICSERLTWHKYYCRRCKNIWVLT